MTIRVVFATDTAALPLPSGASVVVHRGQHWSADDPVVKAHPGLFSDDPRYGLTYSVPPPEMAEAPVEQATAAPGEKRATRRSAS